MRTLRWTIRLFLIHCLFILLVAESLYFQDLDLALSLVYLIVLWQAGIMIYKESAKSPWLNLVIIGAAYQLPGYVMTLLNLLYYSGVRGIAPDFIYTFQLWHTPVLPLLSLYSIPMFDGFSLYFVALFFISPFYLLVMILPNALGRMRLNRAGKFGRR
jgi:hypothetical protein